MIKRRVSDIYQYIRPGACVSQPVRLPPARRKRSVHEVREHLLAPLVLRTVLQTSKTHSVLSSTAGRRNGK
ncbi:hypothetical protein DNU24_20060 [Salmonella enterica subsp. salamae]|uniref:Uncharacterized protein n=1 Tax=Salmonella enterica subsp. salamae TaxID=59202 RepID=A0A5Y3XGB1_SALER|nr:hypothetical protein [Salmonella enterica subsp. salamae]